MICAKELKVGDEIGYLESHGVKVIRHGISTVVKVGKNSLTLADGMKFSFRGWRWGGTPYHCERLEKADEVRNRVARQNRSEGIYRSIYKAIERIEEILKPHQGWNESTPITAAERDEMIALINAIPLVETAEPHREAGAE